VVVTGGRGFIGSHIVKRFEDEGFEVLVLDTAGESPLDVTAERAFEAVKAARPLLVIHAAAQTHVARSLADPVGDVRVNVAGTVAMLEAARQAGAVGFIFLSSAAAYGNPITVPVPESHPHEPLSPYGLSKLAAMRYVQYYRRAGLLPTANLIPANIYGPGQQSGGDGAVVPVFMQAAVRGEPIRIEGDGTQTRDFLYVEDLVESVWLAWRWLCADRGSLREVAAAGATACDGTGGPRSVTHTPATFNIGTGVETSVVELARAVERVTGRSVSRESHPPRPGDITRSCLDPTLARRVLGWVPGTDLEVGLTKTHKWWVESQ
jgi:UDP-glucose 4-epimerase